MIYKTVKIKDAPLTMYVIGNSPAVDMERKHPAVLILPGGGYEFTSDREAEPVALALTAKGYNAFVLRYSTHAEHPEAKYPRQLDEAREALIYIRKNSRELNTDPDKVAVMGFSAGGHLAGCLANISDEKPNAAILCYPVITSGEYAHKGSFTALGADISLEKYVSEKSPPTFIWHTYEDASVPVENALLMAAALRKNKVPFELHIFQNGPHGLSLCNAQTANENNSNLINKHTEKWFDLCMEWLDEINI